MTLSRLTTPAPDSPAGPTPHPTRPPAAGWVPSSPCTPQCLPPRCRPASAGVGLLALRVTALAGLVVLTVLVVPMLAQRLRRSWLCAVSRAALRASGVTLRIGSSGIVGSGIGGPARYADGGVLVVANHLSWIDVLAIGAVQPVRILAKREVRDWPVLGGLAARAGALFVDRATLRALPTTVADTAAALRAGAAVGVFPEGTTWCGVAAGSFRRAAFQAAIDAGVPVRPMAISLLLPDGGPARAATFVGDQTLWDSVRRVLAMRGLVCELTLLPMIPAGTDRRALARRAGDAIASVTGTPHPVPARRVPPMVALTA